MTCAVSARVPSLLPSPGKQLACFSPAAGAAAERVPGEGIQARRLDEQHQADHQLVAARRLEATLHHARPQVGHRRTHGRLQGQGQTGVRVCLGGICAFLPICCPSGLLSLITVIAIRCSCLTEWRVQCKYW